MSTFTPVDYTKVKKKESDYALASLMLLPNKRNGDIKPQCCADVSKQK